MSEEETVTTATAPTTQAQCAQLREQNERLRRENESLKKKIEEARVLRQSWDLDEKGGGNTALETMTYKRKIEDLDQRADVLAVHNELQQLRQRCAIYAEALEESRGYFFEMKRLYAELEQLQGTSKATAAAEVSDAPSPDMAGAESAASLSAVGGAETPNAP